MTTLSRISQMSRAGHVLASSKFQLTPANRLRQILEDAGGRAEIEYDEPALEALIRDAETALSRLRAERQARGIRTEGGYLPVQRRLSADGDVLIDWGQR